MAVAALVACNAHAEIFKCTSADGRILYSDVPCPASSRGEVIVPDDNAPIPAPKPRPPEAAAPPPSRVTSDGQPVAATTGGYELSLNERQRIGNLEQMQRSADNAEKRDAARMEIQEIRRGTLARMSFEDQRRKDGFWVDLGNLDRQRRIVAVRQLTDLFAAYR
jgi:uncharacterized protein DUF4124